MSLGVSVCEFCVSLSLSFMHLPWPSSSSSLVFGFVMFKLFLSQNVTNELCATSIYGCMSMDMYALFCTNNQQQNKTQREQKQLKFVVVPLTAFQLLPNKTWGNENKQQSAKHKTNERTKESTKRNHVTVNLHPLQCYNFLLLLLLSSSSIFPFFSVFVFLFFFWQLLLMFWAEGSVSMTEPGGIPVEPDLLTWVWLF